MNEKHFLIRFLLVLSRWNFGEFDIKEFKKFLKMGVMFALIIGVYWTLKPLRDGLFMQLVGSLELPLVKIISVPALIPLVMLYSKVLEHVSREKMLIVLPAVFGGTILVFGIMMFFVQGPQEVLEARSNLAQNGTKFLGYLWYIIVECFGSLMLALFWSFASDTTKDSSAAKGFPVIAAVGQIGGILCPYLIGCLPYRLKHSTDSLSLIILSVLVIFLIPLAQNFLDETPENLLEGYAEKKGKKTEEKKEPGMLEGLKLLLKHRYLLAIFAIAFIYEVFSTIFDYNFKVAASSQYDGTALTNYLNIYASSVNLVAFIMLMLGISNITRLLGIGIALMVLPLVVALAIFGFAGINTLSLLFAIMVGTKGMNYSLNMPATKQLYIPTSKDARYKAQAWIESFGSRASQQAGNGYNTLLKPMQSSFGESTGRSYFLYMSIAIGIPLVLIWLKSAGYLGKNYKKALKAKEKIC